MRSRRLGVIMDPIVGIKPAKDTTLAMLLEATRRDYELWYFELGDLWIAAGEARGSGRPLAVRDDPARWFELGERREMALGELDVILMRKDPPFDMEYVYATYLLERAEAAGALVVNRPGALRDCNEKAYITWFPQCTAPTVIDRDMGRLRRFLAAQGKIVVKPLEGMGGTSVFVLDENDPNIGVVLETLTARGTRFAMAQRYLPEIVAGDKRILMIDGEPVPYALARIPKQGESRGNLAAGGRGVGVELSERDRWIAAEVSPALREKGLLFVGLDVIGDSLTEINVTSPTCVRELDALYNLNICAGLFDAIEKRLVDA
ncbi:MAG TPA: glutathione synthase [Gammaproteobacteria bacterium]|nr:glutathione synthase [Gammaproteobacteria bacterium]